MEERCQSDLKRALTELDESRIRETKLRRELAKKDSEITVLQDEVRETRENLRLAFVKLDALSEECSQHIEQESTIKVGTVVVIHVTYHRSCSRVGS